MSSRARIGRLEARLPRSRPRPLAPPTLGDEIRALETQIAEIEAEIRAAGGTVEFLELPDDEDEALREIAELEAAMLAEGSEPHKGGESEKV